MDTIVAALGQNRDRLIALGLLALIVSLLVLVVALPIQRAVWAPSKQASIKLPVLERFIAKGAIAPQLTKDLLAAKAQVEREKYALDGATPEQARAALEERIRNAVQSVNGQVTRIQNGKQTEEAGLTEIEALVTLTVSETELSKFLKALETSTPLVLIRSLSIDRSRPAMRPGTPNTPILRLQLRVIGFQEGAAE